MTAGPNSVSSSVTAWRIEMMMTTSPVTVSPKADSTAGSSGLVEQILPDLHNPGRKLP